MRDTFARMAMNDEETVALVAGGHTFGKAHGAGDPGKFTGPEPEAASIEEQGFGWSNSMKSGAGVDTITSGIEGPWTANPIQWDNGYFDALFGYDWKLTKSPAGANQWTPTKASKADQAPQVDGNGTVPLMMTTADMALRMDPAYEKISRRFHKNSDEFADAFARAWYKLTHRDMGPIACCHGKEVAPVQIWQDPIPVRKHKLVTKSDVKSLKVKILKSGFSVGELVGAARASAATFRGTDRRGGANGARIALAPQKDWAVNQAVMPVIKKLKSIQSSFNKSAKGGKKLSLADMIVLAGYAGVEQGALNAGYEINMNFVPGRMDATQKQTDVESFAVLEPKADGFRNYLGGKYSITGEELLVDKAHLLGLTAPEMTALVGGMRAIGANADGSDLGVLTSSKGSLNAEFFTNLLDMSTEWTAEDKSGEVFIGKCRKSGKTKWRASRSDLIFGSNSQLRALAEVYGSADSDVRFIQDFADAFHKVMMNDRFELA